jgi:ferredoxin
MNIEVDREQCIGHAQCMAIAPLVFDVSIYGETSVLDFDPSRIDLELVRRAAENCPTQAITVSADE